MPQAQTDIVQIVDWPGPGDPGYLLRQSPDAEPFHRALAEGRLVLRTCLSCERARYPHGPVCPFCGSTGFEWRDAVPAATLLAWGRSHLEFVPEFPAPYLVGCGALDAGPPLIASLLGPPEEEPVPGSRLRVVAQRWPSGVCVPAFTFADVDEETR